MTVYKPPGSPPCWGQKYQDGEKECEQCRFNETCRSAMLSRIVSPQERVVLPVVQPKPYPPPPPVPSIVNQSIVPLPARPFYAPPVNQIPLPQQQPPKPAPVPPVQPQQTYYQQSTGYSLPNPQNPNPLTPMHRPGAQGPAYYITQYPGESIGTRVAKNSLLRAMEAIMFELMQFFRHWTWPPGRK